MAAWSTWSMREEEAEEGNRVLRAMDVTEIALREMTSVGQFNLIPEYRKHILRGAWGHTLNCSEWHAPIMD